MKFSESWLREWVNPSVSRDALSHQITMAGLEVDGIEPVAAAFSGVIVGEVVECGQHPDADKLRVTKINVGSDELIYCLWRTKLSFRIKSCCCHGWRSIAW